MLVAGITGTRWGLKWPPWGLKNKTHGWGQNLAGKVQPPFNRTLVNFHKQFLDRKGYRRYWAVCRQLSLICGRSYCYTVWSAIGIILSSVCPSVCLWRCVLWLSGSVYMAKSCTSVFLRQVPFCSVIHWLRELLNFELPRSMVSETVQDRTKVI